jgi:hypothetical protein
MGPRSEAQEEKKIRRTKTRIFNPHTSDSIPLLEFEQDIKGASKAAGSFSITVTGSSTSLTTTLRRGMFPVPTDSFFHLDGGADQLDRNCVISKELKKIWQDEKAEKFV